MGAHAWKVALLAAAIGVLIYTVVWVLYQPPLTDVEPARPPPVSATPAGPLGEPGSR
jgi:hypothetical protein